LLGKEKKVRYKDTGNLHKDFHLATDRTIRYVLREYGEEFLRELFYRTAQRVYKDIYENLKAGNWEPLKEHLLYYYEREGGEFSVEDLESGEEGFRFRVVRCPATEHLKVKGVPVTDDFYKQVILLGEGWSENTPFTISTEIEGEGKYTITLRRSEDAAK
jgi:hypothetical protein